MATRSKAYSKPADLIKATAAELHRQQAGILQAHVLLANEIEGDYQELTSGTISSREFRRHGHPLARTNTRGRQRGRIERLPINRQSGRLNRSIRNQRRGQGLGSEWSIGFETTAAGKSIYVLGKDGTRYMVPRGFDEERTKRSKARHVATRRYLLGRL